VTATMDALVWLGPRSMAVEKADVPTPPAGEVLVRVAAAGICGSELEGYEGRMANRTPPLVMGHEFGGVVAEVGPGGDPSLVGKNVAINPLVHCDKCDRCKAGQTNLCGARVIVGIGRPGGFAEYVSVPDRNLLVLPDEMAPEAAALVEPLANVIHAVDLAYRTGTPDSAVVLGAGSLGLLAVQVLTQLGIAQLAVADLSDDRLAAAKAAGAHHIANNRTEPAALDELFTTGPDVVIDCVGAAPTKQQAIRLVRSGGTVVLVGLHDDETPLSSHEIIRREITLTGSFTYTLDDLHRAIDYLASGAVGYEGWTTSRPLGEGPDAFADLLANPGKFTKVFLTPGATS
jgi:2-desacetyl-2-hydroxyethyl bacteriochlorophyllide A dehydrogenase